MEGSVQIIKLSVYGTCYFVAQALTPERLIQQVWSESWEYVFENICDIKFAILKTILKCTIQ